MWGEEKEELMVVAIVEGNQWQLSQKKYQNVQVRGLPSFNE